MIQTGGGSTVPERVGGGQMVMDQMMFSRVPSKTRMTPPGLRPSIQGSGPSSFSTFSSTCTSVGRPRSSKASTLDHCGKMELLQRMRLNPAFGTARRPSDETKKANFKVGRAASGSKTQRGSQGFRSLSSDSRMSLFADANDTPLQMSSIDGVSTQVRREDGGRRRSQSGDSLLVVEDYLQVVKDDGPFILTTSDKQFTLSARNHDDSSMTGRSTLRGKLKQVQEKCRKSSMTTKLKSKLGKKKTDQKEDKLKSYSTDALNNLDFQQTENAAGYANSEIIELERNLKQTSFFQSTASDKNKKAPSSTSSQPSTPRSGSGNSSLTSERKTDFDGDSGFLNEALSDSLSSGGSDSGFYHASNFNQKSGKSKVSDEGSKDSDDSQRSYVTKSKPPKQKPLRAKKDGSNNTIKRRHSRASSVDRRDMFEKYVQKSGELSENIKPFDSGNSELKMEIESSQQKEFRLVRLISLRKHFELDMFLARRHQTDIGCVGYFIVHILPDGLVKR